MDLIIKYNDYIDVILFHSLGGIEFQYKLFKRA